MRLRWLAFIVRSLETILGVSGWWLQTKLRKDTGEEGKDHHCSRMARLQCLGGSRDICDLRDGHQESIS